MTTEIAATQGGPGHGLARPYPRRPRRVRRLRRSVEMAGGLLEHRHRLLRFPGRASFGRRRLHQQGAGRRRLSLFVPRHRGRLCDRARHGHHGAEARSSTPSTSASRISSSASSFPISRALGWEYDFGRLSHRDAEGARGDRTTASCATEQKAKQEAFKRGETRELMGIGVSFFTEIVGAGPSKNCDILGIAMFDSARDPHPSDRARHRAHGHQEPGPGPRDDLGADHRDRDRHSRRRHHDRRGQYRHRALWSWHLRLALDAGRRRGDRHGLAQDQGQGADDRRLHARSARGRSRMGRRPFPRQGQSRSVQDDEPDRLGGLQQSPARHGAGPRGGQLLRSAEHDLSLRRLYLRDGHRRRHRRSQSQALLCARRLRHAHQPDDHRGPGAWRLHRRLRDRDGPGDRLRRDRATSRARR